MSKFRYVLVNFKCCGESRLFTEPREFSFCKCGKTAFDRGYKHYIRRIGREKDLEYKFVDAPEKTPSKKKLEKVKKLCPHHVAFLCCGDSRTFTGYGEFYMCKCGSSGYDRGDEFRIRSLGDPKNIKVTRLGD